MSINYKRLSPTRWFAIASLLAVGYLAGISSRDMTVQADTRRGATEQEHFQSGAQRSEVLLRDISTTLNKLDARVERMEKLATQFVNKNTPPRPVETREQ